MSKFLLYCFYKIRSDKVNNKIKQTEEFLKLKFEESTYFKAHEEEKKYRLEHTYRVANIGKELAYREGFNVEYFVIGCLLHDVSYCLEFKDQKDWLSHGRNAAKIARPFLENLGIEKEAIEDICYGIAIHVDDKADFDGTRSAFALSIGDADNIDRFDVYRIFENLKRIDFDKMSLEEKLLKINDILAKLNKYKNEKLGTLTATELWRERIEYQLSFFEKLKLQVETSDEIKDLLFI